MQTWSRSFDFDNSNPRQEVKKLWKYCQFFISLFAKTIHRNKCLLWRSMLNKNPNLTIDQRFYSPQNFFIMWMVLVIYIVSLFAFDIIGWSQKQDYVLNTLTLFFVGNPDIYWSYHDAVIAFHGESFAANFQWIDSSY